MYNYVIVYTPLTLVYNNSGSTNNLFVLCLPYVFHQMSIIFKSHSYSLQKLCYQPLLFRFSIRHQDFVDGAG